MNQDTPPPPLVQGGELMRCVARKVTNAKSKTSDEGSTIAKHRHPIQTLIPPCNFSRSPRCTEIALLHVCRTTFLFRESRETEDR